MSKSLYKSFENWICNLGNQLVSLKMLYSEWNAIFRKRHLYAGIQWTEEQQSSFDTLFIEHFGRKISPRWHKLYQSMNGVFCADYFPELLYTTKLEKKLNPMEYSEVLCDKNLLKVLFGSMPGVRTAREYVTCCNGVYRDENAKLLSKSAALEILSNVGRVCLKPTVDTGSGKGVCFPVFSHGKEEATGKSIEEVLSSYGKNFTVQECLREHSSFSALHPASLNTLRVITYLLEDCIYHTPLAARIGSGGSNLDNIHAGGLSVGVADDGQMRPQAFRLGYCNQSETFEEHPDTHIRFANHRLAFTPEVLKAAAEAHARIAQLGIVSWDFIVDESGTPVIIEANLMGQSIWFPQIVNGCSAFGKNTGKILELIRE